MRRSDKINRAIAFYSAVMLYIILLPVLLSFSLGYKIDLKALKIHKTGIIYINTSPAGASVYMNEKLIANLTPTQIEELKPGTYKIEVRLEGFYPWTAELVVKPNMVTKADHIVLFPITKELKEMARFEVPDFAIANKNTVYYLTKSGLLRSDMDGQNLQRLSVYSNWPDKIIDRKLSPDNTKLLFFNERNIYVIYLNNLENPAVPGDGGIRVEGIFESQDPIINVFWYSSSSYVIIVTKKDIRVAEIGGGDKRNVVALYKFNETPSGLYYDENNDSLYFTDLKREYASSEARRLYRLDLRQKFFDTLIKLFRSKEIEAAHEKR